MNQIVLIALRRPYTFVVLAILIVLFGTKSVLNTPTDVFPNIKIPVISVVWSYTGLLPIEVSGRITFYFERALTSTVEGIQRIVSQSYYGISIINIFLQPETNLAGAEAEVAAISQTVVKALPPDISPPMIMRLEASSVPVAMLQITSDTLTPAELYNLALCANPAPPRHDTGRDPAASLRRAAHAAVVSLDQQKLLARHLTPADIHKALDVKTSCCPRATRRSSHRLDRPDERDPLKIEDFDDIPIKKEGNAWIHMRDVSVTRLAGRLQTNAVIVDGQQAVILVVMKSSEASTLEVVRWDQEDRSRAFRRSCPRV